MQSWAQGALLTGVKCTAVAASAVCTCPLDCEPSRAAAMAPDTTPHISSGTLRIAPFIALSSTQALARPSS